MDAEANLKQERVRHLDLHEFTVVESGTEVRVVIDKLRQGAPKLRPGNARERLDWHFY